MLNRTVIAIVALGSAGFLPTVAHAWCFADRNCATDNSVCDMGSNTTERLGSKTFVSAKAPRKVEIYQRLAYREIVDHCTNGQVLILRSDGSLSIDSPVLNEVANRVCTVAAVERTPVQSRDPMSKETLNGFELRCRISKLYQFREDLREIEAKESTDQLLAEGNRQVEANRTARVDVLPTKPSSQNPECGKVGWGVFLGGGKCANK